MVKKTFTRVGGMCPRCEGRGAVTDFGLTQLYEDSRSINDGALTIPGYGVGGWYGRIFGGCGFFDPDRPIRRFTKRELHDLLLRLRDTGNTVLVVEHKPETIMIADRVVDLDLGPGAGTAGGTVCFAGTVVGLRASATLTGRHLDDLVAARSARTGEHFAAHVGA